jgi:hypothetical protein
VLAWRRNFNTPDFRLFVIEFSSCHPKILLHRQPSFVSPQAICFHHHSEANAS